MLCLVSVSVLEFCHNLSFWVLSQLKFLSFVTIWVFRFFFFTIGVFEFCHNFFFYHLNTLTTDQLSGQLFAILTMFKKSDIIQKSEKQTYLAAIQMQFVVTSVVLCRNCVWWCKEGIRWWFYLKKCYTIFIFITKFLLQNFHYKFLHYKISITKFALQNVRDKICVTKFALQNLSYKICVTKFAIQNLRYKMCVTKFALQNLH